MGLGIDENQHKLVQSTQNFETDRTVTVPWAKTFIFAKLKCSIISEIKKNVKLLLLGSAAWAPAL